MIPLLLSSQEKLKANVSVLTRDFKRNMLIFLSKFLIKYRIQDIYNVFNNNGSIIINTLNSQLKSIIDIDEFSNKRLVLNSYSNFLINQYDSIGKENSIMLLQSLLNGISCFHRLGKYYVPEDKPVEADDVYAINIKSSLNLENAKINLAAVSINNSIDIIF